MTTRLAWCQIKRWKRESLVKPERLWTQTNSPDLLFHQANFSWWTRRPHEVSTSSIQMTNGTLTLHIFFFFLAAPPGLQDLSSPTRDWTRALAMKVLSPNPLTARNLPGITYFDDLLICGLAFHGLWDICHDTVLLHRDHLDGHGNCLSREDGGVQDLSVLREERDIPGSRELFGSLGD